MNTIGYYYTLVRVLYHLKRGRQGGGGAPSLWKKNHEVLFKGLFQLCVQVEIL